MSKLYFLIVFFCLASINIFAQEEDLTERQKKKLEKQQVLDSLAKHAMQNKPPPDIKIGFGLITGVNWINADVAVLPLQLSLPGYNFGVTIETTFDRIFSLKLGGKRCTAIGMDYKSYNVNNTNNRNLAITGSEFYTEIYNSSTGITPNYLGEENLFLNYKTTFTELYIHTVFNLRILDGFYINAISGLGSINYNTKMDLLFNNNIYDFSNVTIVGNNLNEVDLVYNDLEILLDGTYESQAEIYRNNDNSTKTNAMALYAGFGFTFLLNESLKLGIDYNVAFLKDDLIDGQSRNLDGSISQNYDKPNSINLKLSFVFQTEQYQELNNSFQHGNEFE